MVVITFSKRSEKFHCFAGAVFASRESSTLLYELAGLRNFINFTYKTSILMYCVFPWRSFISLSKENVFVSVSSKIQGIQNCHYF